MSVRAPVWLALLCIAGLCFGCKGSGEAEPVERPARELELDTEAVEAQPVEAEPAEAESAQAESAEAMSAQAMSAQAMSAQAMSAPEAEDSFKEYSVELAIDDREGRRISIDEVLQLAGEQSWEVLVAEEGARIAEAQADVERSAMIPALEIGTSVFYFDGIAQNTPGDIFDVTKQNAFAGLGLALTLELGDSLYATRAANERSEAAEHAVRGVVVDIRSEAVRRYYGLMEAYAALSIVEGAIDAATELLSIEQARFDGGAGLEADLLRATARLRAAERERIATGNQVDFASILLAEILALDARVSLVPAENVIRTIRLFGNLDRDELFAEARARHPALAEAEALIRASEEEAKGADIGWLIPDLTLLASYGGLGFNYGDLGGQGSVGAAISWDLGFDIPAVQHRAKASARRARLLANLAIQRLEGRLARAAATIEAADEQVVAAAATLEAATEARLLARRRFEGGASILLDTVDAELLLIRSRIGLAAAIAAYDRAQYELLFSLGG